MSYKAPSYLYRNRFGIFYFRVVIPLQYRQYFIHKREIKRSLKTSNKKIALKLGRIYMSDLDKLLSEIQSGKRRTSQLITFDNIKLKNGNIVEKITLDHSQGNCEEDRRTLLSVLDQNQIQEQNNDVHPLPQEKQILDDYDLQTVSDKYCKSKVVDKTWSNDTSIENEATLALFIKMMGAEKKIKKITRIDLTLFREKFVLLPANMNKAPRYKGKKIDEILQMDNVIPKAQNTINKALTCIQGMFSWANKSGFISENIASDLPIGKDDEVDRDPYDEDDLKKLFESDKIDKFDTASKYWVPVIALYSGLRLNEICQMYLMDIQKINDLDVFVIQAAGKNTRLKNKASKRKVPIHSKLIELGLMDYIEFLKQEKQERLFPELRFRDKGGFGSILSKSFQRYNVAQGTYVKQKKVFHSFRNTIVDFLKNEEVERIIVSAIAGHKDPSITYSCYAKAYRPAILKKYIEKVDYGLNHRIFDLQGKKLVIKRSWN